jgi:hypothetical protein
MELQRRSQPRSVPVWRKIALNGGLGDPAINPTTIWTPQTGYLNTPGTLADGYQFQPQVFSAYDVPGLLLPYESCVDEMGGTAGDSACVDRNLAVQQENVRRTAQYNAGAPVSGVTRPTWDTARPTGGSSTGGGSAPSSFAFTNLTSGDNSNFKVGDRWEIRIQGAPNSPVSMNGGRNGENKDFPMGSTDGAGKFTANGQMTAGEIGNWSEAWRVNNQIVASFTFRVLPAGSASGDTTFTGNTGGAQSIKTTQSSISKSVFDTLPGGSVSIGGNEFPVWGLAVAAVAAFFIFKGGK